MPITIRLKRNGPYLIAVEQAAEVVVVDADGNVLTPEPGRPIKLCRCGDSSTKPFCDGTHRHNGFACDTEAVTPPIAGNSPEPGPGPAQ